MNTASTQPPRHRATNRDIKLQAVSLVIAAALSLGVAGCERVQYRSTLPPSGQVYGQWNNFFLFGLVGDALILPNAVCPQGVYGVDVYHSFGNLVLTALTIGLYSPTTAEIRCAAHGSPVGRRGDRAPARAASAPSPAAATDASPSTRAAAPRARSATSRTTTEATAPQARSATSPITAEEGR